MDEFGFASDLVYESQRLFTSDEIAVIPADEILAMSDDLPSESAPKPQAK